MALFNISPTDMAKFPYPFSLRIFANGSRLYAPIFNLMVVESAIAHAARPFIVVEPGVKRGDSIYWMPKVYPKEMLVSAYLPFEFALRDIKPDTVVITLVDRGTTAKVQDANPGAGKGDLTSGFADIFLHLVEPVFLAFFERYNVWLTKNLGDAANWPPALNFARVIRNAVAHGAIDIRNPNTPPATWQGLSYSHADNGRKIIGTDLNSADLVGLMFDVEDALDVMSVPIL